ncbi:MAG: response regulator [Candidatus Omnitrophica bacterium]|nr:response regulator [Candidatus Omnitrophota bacterium]
MKFRILIVDDDKEILDTLQSRLAREGYEVVTALDGEEALLKVKQDDPDIIILDLLLPKLNGFEVLKEIRQKYEDKWRPVIIISAQAELDSLRKGYALEADHYLTKPVTMEKVLQGVETLASLIPLRIHKE